MAEADAPAIAATRCPRCGSEFCCGTSAGQQSCWCMDLPLLPAADLTAAACYCPQCLKELLSAAMEA